ncbi:MAG: phytanoyl-CoA dioxygenase family protein [Chloroflexi bacterium]|nr:phytanoyl-CoA dioxygenase family protein [Chloroflexota bacterium]
MATRTVPAAPSRGAEMGQAKLGKAAFDAFWRDGFYLQRSFFDPKKVEAAAAWLRSQDHSKMAKSWTEQEPAVELAVWPTVHTGDHPIAELANDRDMLDMAGELMGAPVYIWSSKVNIKAAWCGTAEYHHQDLVYWKDRGYPRDEMLSCMVYLEPHTIQNAALVVLPGTHKYGYIEHEPFININGLSKYMVPPATLSDLYRKHGYKVVEAQPGDVLFFHTSLVHGSSHNISPHSRTILLSQLNTVGNEPKDVSENARLFNLRRSQQEKEEAERRYRFFTEKYEKQLGSKDVTFGAPIPERERK